MERVYIVIYVIQTVTFSTVDLINDLNLHIRELYLPIWYGAQALTLVLILMNFMLIVKFFKMAKFFLRTFEMDDQINTLKANLILYTVSLVLFYNFLFL